jgi:hypothetical protein
MAWNTNSPNQRFDSCDLINLLMTHNPTTISISEIKTSLITFRDLEGLRLILKTRGGHRHSQMALKVVVILELRSFPKYP